MHRGDRQTETSSSSISIQWHSTRWDIAMRIQYRYVQQDMSSRESYAAAFSLRKGSSCFSLQGLVIQHHDQRNLARSEPSRRRNNPTRLGLHSRNAQICQCAKPGNSDPGQHGGSTKQSADTRATKSENRHMRACRREHVSIEDHVSIEGECLD
ncbi:hypothetical protein PLICRDRAFT_617248 [Plicaturopsis crispa FD-325 SS-3]|nr:hypothetical protein PLICRDRAFT_617248 [Plicaturopsis crispa FD-325 SS-3]